MQSRFDHLIHKHDGQRSRRFIPGAFMAAATAVAVVVFLLTSSTIQAHEPSVGDPRGGAICEGLAEGVLDVGTLRSENATYTDSDCQFYLTVTPPTTQGEVPTDCQVNYTPAMTGDGLEVAYEFVGACDGVEVSSEVTFAEDQGIALASSSSTSKWAISRLIGHDVAHIPMFWHYSRVDWSYANGTISTARQTVDRFTNQWWLRHMAVKGTNMNSINTIYDAWDEVDWHSDGFPTTLNRDVYAESKVTTRVRGTGSYTCYFRFKWVSGAGWYPNLHKHTYCQTGS
ncbi:MAG: hypothetical protein OXN86_11255 [Chloroflexota bacterium]|nr:hypothetical protein [Chloroflexota bacterium]MDE2893069.1 hypothetical protein [Chloroflexota bacterium]